MRPSSLATLHRAAFLLLASATPLLAQAPGYGDSQPFHALYVTTGATTMSVDPVNAVLTKNAFAGLSTDGISYGAGGYYAFGRALLGAEYVRTTFGEEGLSSGRTDDLNAQQLAATVSFALVATGRLNLFPTVGVGLGHFDVTLRDRSGGAANSAAQPTWDEVAQSPGAETTLSGSHLLYTVGGGADYLITRGAPDHAGVVFGVRAGFAVAPNRTTWTAAGRTVVAGPDASSGGPFLRIVVGIGGR
jgi:hypothetical protein